MSFGKSDKLPGSGEVPTQVHYLSQLIEQLQLEDIRLIVHDWGGPVGFAYAAQNPDKVAGVAFFQTAFAPFPSEDALPSAARAVRDPVTGRQLVVDMNFFLSNLRRVTTNLTARVSQQSDKSRHSETYPKKSLRYFGNLS